jgi:HK97 gp10 family phage protein
MVRTLADFTLNIAALETAVQGLAVPELHKIGAAVATEAKRLAPVDTGRLRASIYSQPEADGVEIGATAEYAAYLEHGTRFAPAQPYMQPAIYKVAGNVNRKRAG